MVFHRDASLERDFGRILRVVVLQTEASTGTPGGGDERLLDAEVLAFKVLQHAMSVLVLYRGASLEDLGFKTPYRDLFSILGLARMCHESYVLFHHIFVAQISEEEREFRYLAWLYVDARKLARFPTCPEVLKELKEYWTKFADDLIHRLEDNPVYGALSQPKKRGIREHLHWPPVDCPTLARQAGFNELHAFQIYKYLCSYSHPGGVAIRQAREVAEQGSVREWMENGLKHATIILACLASDIPTVYPVSRPVLEVDAEGSRLVGLYASFARNKSEDYGLKLVE